MTLPMMLIKIKIKQAMRKAFIVPKKRGMCLFVIRIKMKNRFTKLFVRPKYLRI
jgi:hypothetical protein